MWKYIKLLGGWKEISKVYKEEKGTDKPWYASRRFFGSVFMFIGLLLKAFLDVASPEETLTTMADGSYVLAEVIKDSVPAIISLYGAVTTVIGAIKKSKVENRHEN